ncbi:hypothetical protein C7I84_27025 [Mesorhizobium ephedrae]|uniref:Uncharacterized protein n=1 Tax=Kumtagia ephedrae TaxID=2116701 RepID=A0A2P7RNH9_9HYPH|nr:hypothetical protein C7I84_27025 [Mesorhizobium ephedrae]
MLLQTRNGIEVALRGLKAQVKIGQPGEHAGKVQVNDGLTIDAEAAPFFLRQIDPEGAIKPPM